MLGASWATYRAVVERLGSEPRMVDGRRARDCSRTAATADPRGGDRRQSRSRGRGDGTFARLRPRASSYPPTWWPLEFAGIESEGAQVEVVDGTYDDAVARSAAAASDRTVVISDTSWAGYTEPPRHVIEGYSTIFFEIEDALGAHRHGTPRGRARPRRRRGPRRRERRLLPPPGQRPIHRRSCASNRPTPPACSHPASPATSRTFRDPTGRSWWASTAATRHRSRGP